MSGVPDGSNALDAVSGLADAVAALRGELEEAQRQALQSDMRFRIGEVEMEFLVELQREREGKGGLRVWVVEAGVRGSMSHGSTHRVKLTLHPFDSKSGRDAEVLGRARRGGSG